MTTFSIRPATTADIPAILAIEQSAPTASHGTADQYKKRIETNVPQVPAVPFGANLGTPIQNAQASSDSVANLDIRTQAACVLVAESNARITGFLCARIVAGEWELENVVVEQNSRRRGIASELMRSLIALWDRARGTALLLEVRESNSAARALYASHGLREVGRRCGYYRGPVEDAILYARYRGD